MIWQALSMILCIFVIWTWKKDVKKKKKTLEPPDLSGKLPLLGHIFKLIGDRKHAFNLVRNIAEEMLQKKQDVLTFDCGFCNNYYMICDPDVCSLVLNICLDKNYYYSFAKPFLGNGLTIADVALWKKHRKILNPAFRQQALNAFLPIFNNYAKNLINQLRVELGNGYFNHEEYLRENSLQSICMTAFGADVNDFDGLHKQYLNGVDEVLKIFTERFKRFWLHNDFLYYFSDLKKRQDKVVRSIEEFTYSVFKRKKAQTEDNVQYKPDQFKPLLDTIIDVSSETGCYTDDDILGEINTVVGGAYDTSTCTLTLALMLLGSYPDVQKRAYDEIQEVFENSERNVKKDDLPKLQYIEAVLKETLRLYPIAPVVSRYLVKDIQLKNYNLKAGNGVVILIWALHRHPAWGSDVDLFKPERWLDPSTLPENPNFFAPFSLGRRGCIGKTYAMMSMKTTLVHVLRSYSIRSDVSKLQLEMDTFIRPVSGHHITIEKRQNI